MDFNFELFEGKKYSDLMKDIVKNHKSKQGQIKVLIEQLTDMVSEPGDAVVLVPLSVLISERTLPCVIHLVFLVV